LALALERGHDDPWLEEFLRIPSSPRAQIALRTAINDNIRGDHQQAVIEASVAGKLFKKSGNTAGFLRSELEIIYGFRRQSKAKECLTEFSSLSAWLTHNNYHWLSLRILIEISGCLAMNNQFDEAWRIAQEAAGVASQTGYDALHLRALGYLGSFDTVAGRLRQAWLMDEAGLSTFWKGAFSDDRGYQFYSDLESAAERQRQWHSAITLEQEALAQFQRSPRLDFQSLARCHLSQLLETTGDFVHARVEIELSRKALETLPQNSTTSLYKADCDLTAAAFELRHGSVNSALEKLTQAKETVSNTTNFTVSMRYEKTWADLERRKGNSEEEGKHLRSALAIAQAGFSSLKSAKDRWDWHHAVNEIYHRLLELELKGPHDPEDAYADWELFRSVESQLSPNRKSDFFGTANERRLVSRRLAKLHDSSVVGFMMSPQSIKAWVADDRGVKEFHIAVESEEVGHLVFAFYDLCSKEETPLEKVKADGFRLYRLLFQPLGESLAGRNTIFIEADEILSRIPWSALVLPDGDYLGQSKAIVNTPGLLYMPAHKRGKQARDKMLVVYPGSVTFENTKYPPLPQAEAEADYVAHVYPNTRYLRDQDVSTRELLKELPEASMFHFTGHAATRQDKGELIIHGDSGGDALSASQLAVLNLSGMRLAVLSACSTSGESEATGDPNGLVRALLDAGVQRAVASQWDIDSDASKDLMWNFYRALDLAQTSEGALREAWKSLAGNSHPYYWAAFQVFGPVN
jgi:CHAT domain-containing protein